MTDVHRFTTDYIPVEDRMRISVERKDGSVQVLWLTRPLLNKLVVRLVKSVNPVPLSDEDASTHFKNTAHQRFEQQAAEAALPQQKPVCAGSSARQAGIPVLVTSVGLREGQRELNLDFKGGNHVLQTIPFSSEARRQWLGVLHRCYCRAGWGGGFWPDWISTGQVPDNAARMN